MFESPEITPAPTRSFINPEYHSTLIGAGIYLIFYAGMVLFNAFPPKLPPLLWALLAPLTTILYIFFLTYALRMFCRLRIRLWQETLLMFGTLLLFLSLNPVVREIVTKLKARHGWQQILSQLSMTGADNKSVTGIMLQILLPFLLILTAAFFGQILARIIRERALLLPVGIIAALVDFWGVFWGPVGSLAASAPAVVTRMASAASAAVAVPHTVTLPSHLQVIGHIAPPSSIGIGDFVFLAMFFTCAYRLNFSPRRTMWGVFVAMLFCSIIMALNGQHLWGITINFDYLPGLVFIAGGVLLANIGAWKLSRQEWGMTLALAGIFLLFIGFSGYKSFATAQAKRRRAAQEAPHLYQTATLSTPSCRAAIQQLFAHLKQQNKQQSGIKLIPLGIKVLFTHKPHTVARAEHWTCLAVELREGATTSQLRDFIANAGWNSKTSAWDIQVYSECPPSSSLQLLEQLHPKRDTMTLLRNAQAIPATAYLLLDLKNGIPSPDTLPSKFLLRLLPTSGELATPKGIIKLPYTGGVSKATR